MPRTITGTSTNTGAPPPDLTGYVTDTELTSYATDADLTAGLATKQDAGTYATADDVSNVWTSLGGKQDTLTISSNLDVNTLNLRGDNGKLRLAQNTSDYTLLGTVDGADNTRVVISGNSRGGGWAGCIEYLATSATGEHRFLTNGSPAVRVAPDKTLWAEGDKQVATRDWVNTGLASKQATLTNTTDVNVQNLTASQKIYAETNQEVATRSWVNTLTSGTLSNPTLQSLAQIEPRFPYYVTVGTFPTSAVRSYPTSPLIGTTTVVTGQKYGNFTWYVNASSWQPNYIMWLPFTPNAVNLNANGTTWRSAAGLYDATSGAYTGGVSNTLADGSVYTGELMDVSLGAGNHMLWTRMRFTQADAASRPSRIVLVTGGRPGYNSFDLVADLTPTYDSNGYCDLAIPYTGRLYDNIRFVFSSIAGGGSNTYVSVASWTFLLAEPDQLCGSTVFTGAQNHFVNLPTVYSTSERVATREWVGTQGFRSAADKTYVTNLAKGSDAITVGQVTATSNDFTFTPKSGAVRARSHYIFHVSVFCYSKVDLFTGLVRTMLRETASGSTDEYVVDVNPFFQSQYQRQCVSWTWTTAGLNAAYDTIGYTTFPLRLTVLVDTANMLMDRINITVQEIPV